MIGTIDGNETSSVLAVVEFFGTVVGAGDKIVVLELGRDDTKRGGGISGRICNYFKQDDRAPLHGL